MQTFLSKTEVAKLITNQLPTTEEKKEKIAIQLARLHEVYFLEKVKKAGFSVENFGYNRYYIN